MKPIHLSDDELEAVMNACRPLLSCDRDQFLKDIATKLSALPLLGPGAVHRAIVEVQRRHFDPPDLRAAVGKYD